MSSQLFTHIYHPTFRSWASYGPLDSVAGDPLLIIKTGFLVQPDKEDEKWPISLHNFWVYDGKHELLGTLEPCVPESPTKRRFKFHDHANNEFLPMPGVYGDMESAINDLLQILSERVSR
jgi:hypothetical protein